LHFGGRILFFCAPMWKGVMGIHPDGLWSGIQGAVGGEGGGLRIMGQAGAPGVCMAARAAISSSASARAYTRRSGGEGAGGMNGVQELSASG